MALGGQAPLGRRILSRGPVKYSLGAIMKHRSPVKVPLGLYVTPCLLGLAAQGWSQPACQDLLRPVRVPRLLDPETPGLGLPSSGTLILGLTPLVQRSLSRSLVCALLGFPTSTLRKGSGLAPPHGPSIRSVLGTQ